MNRRYRLLVLPAFALAALLSTPSAAQNPIHVTYLWHMHQPIYYPRLNVTDTDNSGNFNFSVRGVHDSRTGPYTDWPKNAVQQGADRGMPHAGVQVSFSGSLMENLDGIWDHGWREHYRWGRNGLRTTFDNPRLDLVGFAYHHSLMPLTTRQSMKMQIRLHREAYSDVWNTGGGYSKGFFPPESSFAMHMVPALVEEGIEWVLIDSGHIDRTLEDLPWSSASSIRPNRADQRNGVIADWNSQWTQLQNVWAPTPVAAPFSYQPRRIRYVDPWSDPNDPTIYSMIAVPAARYEGNENARGGYGAFKPENVWGSQLDKNNNPDRPMLMVAHSDGDNFGMLNADVYHGQHGFFLDMVQNNANFAHTSVQDYLELHPVPANDPYIHIEPGSWIGIDGGTPYFEKWVEDNPRDGEHPDHWSWSVLIAAMNRVQHAESLENQYSMNDVRWGIGSDTAKAWYHYLNAEASDYWYWDFDRANPWDGNVTRAANLSIAEANKVIARHPGVDTVGPSIFHPQRPIWNPGGNHWGQGDNNLIQPSDFDVWTFVDDVSGVAAVRLYWRTADWGSYADLDEFAHEIYAHSPGKNSPWTVEPMSGEWYPPVQGPLVPDPLNRAMRYSGWINGQSDTLVSYFVEAVDTVGNTNRSEIFHVWVGEDTDGGGGTGPRVTFDPPNPEGCDPITIRYRKAGSALGSGQVYIHIGRNDWQDVILPNPAMIDDGDYWMYVYTPPEDTTQINVAFNDGDDAWDNNGGNNWHLTVTDCGEGGEPPPPPPETVTIMPENPEGCDPITIQYNPNGRPLVGANPVYIHIGHNGWQDVILPNPAMTLNGSTWSYTYNPPPGTTNISLVFNDGGATWDNNSEQNWNFTVTGCEAGPPPPTGLAITNPPADIVVGYAVDTYDLQGIAEDVEGDMSWTNTLTGASGAFPAVTPWSLPGVALGVGANVITVSGEIPGSGEIQIVAEDTASNYVEWTHDSNEGAGFGAWSLSADENAGHFSNENGWGFWAHPGNLSEAIRPFSQPLTAGQTFSVRMRNGDVRMPGEEEAYGGGVGVALQNAAGDTLWQFWFNGGDDFYNRSGGQTDVGWTPAGIDLSMELTGATTYTLTVHPQGSAAQTYAGEWSENADQVVARFRAWSWDNGVNNESNDFDFFVDNLAVTEPGTGEPVWTNTSVTITRSADEGDSNGDGVPDQWYLDHGYDPTIPSLAQQFGANGHMLKDSHMLGLNPTDAESTFKIDALGFVGGEVQVTWGGGGGRQYIIQHADALYDDFEDIGDPIQLNGTGRHQRQDTIETPEGPRGHYRVRFVE